MRSPPSPSYLDQLLTGGRHLDVLLPAVELSHDGVNLLVGQRVAAGAGRRQLQETESSSGPASGSSRKGSTSTASLSNHS
ncbi:hypothetical protein EYF80_029075 [Liparis tanakae]|uniref:Uncharacterized protein n=1 Tax=Liparis tanakae TaxID=230148 RepID=A0A4Z2H526_9TELE|nr:hypothetical protein EYF80_029075 [Liparis tanakae]